LQSSHFLGPRGRGLYPVVAAATSATVSKVTTVPCVKFDIGSTGPSGYSQLDAGATLPFKVDRCPSTLPFKGNGSSFTFTFTFKNIMKLRDASLPRL
jgi:hypothetical protein